MTTRGQRRTAPALIGLGTGALVAMLIAGVVAVVGPVRPEAPAAGDPAVGNAAVDNAAAAPPVLDAPPETPTPAPPPGPAGSADKPAAGAKRAPSFVVALPGLPPYLPALLSRIPGPPKPKTPPKPAAPKKPAVPGLSGPAAAVVALTNAERAKAGCKPLQVDSRLNKSALGHSSDMARRDYFEHDSPEGKDFADREAEAGFEGNSGGENIAMGQRSAAEVMDDWMHSPGHKRNILDCKFTKIGVGYVPNGHYWTQNFGG